MPQRTKGRHENKASQQRMAGKPKSLLHERLAAAIGGRILAGAYAPGKQLPNEAQWGQEFNASRTAVREAIKTLHGKGLLVSRPKIGSIVEPRSRWNLLDRDVLAWHFAAIDRLDFLNATQEARKILEPGVAGLAAAKRTPEQLARLEAALEDMRAARSAGEMIDPDVRYHAALLECANNDLLAPFAILIEHTLGNLFDYTTRNNPKPESVLPMHEAVVREIRRGNSKRARDAMQRLLDDTDAVIANGKRATRPRGAAVRQRRPVSQRLPVA